MDLDAVKDRVVEEVDRRADLLVDASHRIHERPELLFEERFAAELLTDMLEKEGFDVERGAYGLETAFAARTGRDAAVLGYNAVAALRQHIRPDERVHGVFTKAGDKPNIVPDHTVAEWYVRSPTLASLQPLKERVRACLEAGATAAGCRMEL